MVQQSYVLHIYTNSDDALLIVKSLETIKSRIKTVGKDSNEKKKNEKRKGFIIMNIKKFVCVTGNMWLKTVE